MHGFIDFPIKIIVLGFTSLIMLGFVLLGISVSQMQGVNDFIGDTIVNEGGLNGKALIKIQSELKSDGKGSSYTLLTEPSKKGEKPKTFKDVFNEKNGFLTNGKPDYKKVDAYLETISYVKDDQTYTYGTKPLGTSVSYKVQGHYYSWLVGFMAESKEKQNSFQMGTYDTNWLTMTKDSTVVTNAFVKDSDDVNSIGKNLLSNSSWNQGQGAWTRGFDGKFEILSPESDDSNAILHAKANKSQYQQVAQNPNPIKVEAGETFTLSFDYKDKNFTKNFNTMVIREFSFEKPQDDPNFDSTTEKINGNDWSSQANSIWYKTFNTSELGMSGGVPKFKRFSVTFTVPKSGWINIIPYDSDDTGNHESFWRKLKVEKGDVATDWSE